MAFIDNLKKQLPNDVTLVVQLPQVEQILGKSVEEVYREQPALRAVVDYISRNVAQLPLHCFKRQSNNDRVRDTNGKLAKLLNNPNPTMTQYELIDRLMHDYKLYGWALWYVIPSANTSSGWEIDPIPVAWIKNTPTTDGFSPSYYEVNNPATKKTTKLPAASCIRFASYNPGNPSCALSPVDALKNVLAEQMSSLIFRNQQWKNGGRFTSYVKRPVDAPDWSPAAREKFIEALKRRFTGNTGREAGGMPLMEDGMTIESTQFSSRDAQWSEATRLSREDVAGVYHVNPAMVWSNDGQTYASVKENARQLYTDTLGPDLRMIQDRINDFLIPMIGAPSNEYVEFNIQAKLNGSFEEQAAALQAAVGAPYMTREEARGIMNLPRLYGQELEKVITPLNVIAGAQENGESTNQTDETIEESTQDATSSNLGDEKTKEAEIFDIKDNTALESDVAPRTIELKAKIDEGLEEELVSFFGKFFSRQEKSFLNDIGKARAKEMTDEEIAVIFKKMDLSRWNRELRNDLNEILSKYAQEDAAVTMEALGFERSFVDEYMDTNCAGGYIHNWTQSTAENINNTTVRGIARALDPSKHPFSDDDAIGSTVEGVFLIAKEKRAGEYAERMTTTNNSIARIYAVKECGMGEKAVKVWRSSGKNTRKSHRNMNGETIPFYTRNEDDDGEVTFSHAKFSNGQRFPGDFLPGQAGEVAGCRCRMDIKVIK